MIDENYAQLNAIMLFKNLLNAFANWKEDTLWIDISFMCQNQTFYFIRWLMACHIHRNTNKQTNEVEHSIQSTWVRFQRVCVCVCVI